MTSDTLFDELASADRDAAFDRVTTELESRGDTASLHALFDVLMLRAKLDCGLPAARPAAISGVPDEHRPTVEVAYRDAARRVGGAILEQGDLISAWSYFQAIREPAPVRAALDKVPSVSLDPDGGFSEERQELAQLALYEGVHPAKGVEMMLSSTGTCGTITALEQVLPQLDVKGRKAAAAVIVKSLHADLLSSVKADIERQSPLPRVPETLPELLQLRPEVVEGGAYHVDVSHLGAVVRFARSLDKDADALPLAIELCEYGRRLSSELRYHGDPPFEDSYVAHGHFFRAVLGASEEERNAGLDYFRGKLEAEPDEQDKPLLAYVLTDLLMRCDRQDEAVEVGGRYLADVGEQAGFSFTELCENAGKMDRLAEISRQRDDVVGFLAGRFGRASDGT